VTTTLVSTMASAISTNAAVLWHGDAMSARAGYGLSGMAERVRAVAGPVTAGTDGGSGFRVHVAVP
jgi:signal transduction histidine kinase